MAGPASCSGYMAELGFELEATWLCVLVPSAQGHRACKELPDYQSGELPVFLASQVQLSGQ